MCFYFVVCFHKSIGLVHQFPRLFHLWKLRTARSWFGFHCLLFLFALHRAGSGLVFFAFFIQSGVFLRMAILTESNQILRNALRKICSIALMVNPQEVWTPAMLAKVSISDKCHFSKFFPMRACKVSLINTLSAFLWDFRRNTSNTGRKVVKANYEIGNLQLGKLNHRERIQVRIVSINY